MEEEKEGKNELKKALPQLHFRQIVTVCSFWLITEKVAGCFLLLASFWALTFPAVAFSPCSSRKAHCTTYAIVFLGGDPAAGSPTATLLRLFPPYETQIRRSQERPRLTQESLGWNDGRCVQGAGTYSPRASDTRLLGIPCSRG